MKNKRDLNPNFFSNDTSNSNSIITSNERTSRPSVVSKTLNTLLASSLRRARASGSLNMSNNQLHIFPLEVCNYATAPIDDTENFWEIFPLTKVDLSYNKIGSIPDDIGLLNDLTSLRLRDNIVQSIGEGIRHCKQLTSIDLTGNQLESIGEYIGYLTELRELLLSNNHLSYLSPEINNCQLIHTLELQNNKLKVIPELNVFPHLKKLNLSGNLLESLPLSVGYMTSLTSIDLKKNRLRNLPDLSQLRGLSILDVSENMLQCFPVLPRGSMLDKLYLSHNNLLSIDVDEILKVKDSLTELHINDNKLTVLAPEIGHLSKLTILHLGNNDLSDLPTCLGYSQALSKILLDGNPIRTIRRTLLTLQATNDLKAYLRTRGGPLDDQSQVNRSQSSSSKLSKSVAQSSLSTPLERMLEDRVRNISGGLLDLSKQQKFFNSSPYSSSEYWSRSLYSILAKFSDESDRMEASLIRKDSRVTSVAELGGYDSFSNTFSPIQLARLDLSQNVITNIWLPAYDDYSLLGSISGVPSVFKRLEWLNLSNNQVYKDFSLAEDLLSTHRHASLLPTTLKYLDISGNRVDTYQVDILLFGLSNLQELHASNNVLQILPTFLLHSSGFKETRALRVLRLNSNKLTSIDGIAMEHFPALESLDLSDNQINDISPLADSLQATRKQSIKLSTLLLANNAIREIPPSLGLIESLQHFTLHGNPQKSIRSNQLDNVEAILLSLRNRLPTDIVSSSAAPLRGLADTSNKVKMQSESYTTEKTTQGTLPRQSSVRTLGQLEEDIADLEMQLKRADDIGASMAPSKRLQLQKTLALKRANYNRLIA